ncbi:putative ribonuclease H-like domain-containing protein [Tanacetum coccineum]
MLPMALPNEHLMTFNQYKDAQTLFAAIQTRFGGNEATKKTQKTLLKQMYENFSALSTKSLDSIFNWLQKILDMRSPKWSVLTATRWDTLQGNAEDLGTKIAETGIKTALEKDYNIDISYKDSEISMLKSELEKFKQEKESNQLKIENFDNAFKRLFSPPKFNLSNSCLEEFQQPEFQGYGPQTRPKAVNTDRPNSAVVNAVRTNQGHPQKEDQCYVDSGWLQGTMNREQCPISQTLKNLIEDMLPLKEEPKEGKLLKAQIIRCDNGTEFKNRVMSEFCEEKCIKKEFSAARTLQQNGVAKRRNRTLIEAVRTMLADSKLPTIFWAEAVNIAFYVHNRVLVVKPHNKTPYELFRGKLMERSNEGFFFDILNDSDAGKKDDEGLNKESGIDDQERPKYSTQDINTARPSINTASTNVNTGNLNINTVSLTVTTAPLEVTHANFFGDETEVDIRNITTTYPVPSTPNTRIHKDHSLDHVIGDVQSGRAQKGNPSIKRSKLDRSYWTLVDLPHGKRAIGTKWVYINKKDERGIVIRNKARLVAQGYTQEEGIDYDEVFAPVAMIEAIRLFLAYASFKDFVVYQMDVKSAFLYGKIEEEVYVCQPLGFEDPEFPDRVYKVEKALYGLHQAPRAWYETLSTYLLENRFHRGTIDKTLFIKKVKSDILLVQVYVDDIIFRSTKKELCTEFEKLMHKKFQMSSMGELTFFLGLQVTQKDDGIFISQDKYVDEILKKFSFLTMKTASTPMETSKPLMNDENAKDVDDSPFDLEAYTDSDYAGLSLDNKSTTGDCRFLRSGLISWQCKKQTIVANSTTEAKYVAAARYVLMVNPTFYTSCVKQFWATVKAKTVNGEVKIQALVDGKKVIVTEKSVRRALQLKDAKGTKCLPNATIFKQLTLMGAKTTSWKEFSSTMTSSGLCKCSWTKQVEGITKHKEIYVTPSHTKKVFANMKSGGKGFSGRVAPLFQTMMVQDLEKLGEGSEIPIDPQNTPTIIQPFTSQPQKKQPRRKQRKDTEVLQPSGSTKPITDEAANAKHIPTYSNDPLFSGEDRLQLKELLELYTKLSERVLDLENTKTSQAAEITKLNKRVKKLERSHKSRLQGLKRLRKVGRSAQVVSSKDEGLGAQEDASKQGRKITDLDADAEVTLVDEAQERNFDNLMFNTGVFYEREVEVEKVVSTTEVNTISATRTTVDELTLTQTLIEIKVAKPKAVTSAATTTTTTVTRPKARGVVVQEPSEFTKTTSLSQLSQLPQAKDKGKAKMIEPEKPLKKKDQILIDEEIAQKLQAQLNAELEEENLAKQRKEDANIAEWDNVQAMIDADYELATRLQIQEQEELIVEEKLELFVELMDKRKKHFARLRAEEQRRKPTTKAQKRNQMCTYLKNMAGFTRSQLKNKSFDEVQKAFDKTMGWIDSFVSMDFEVVKGGKDKDEGSVTRAEESSSKRAGIEIEQEIIKK